MLYKKEIIEDNRALRQENKKLKERIDKTKEKIREIKEINNEVYKQTDELERFYSRKWCNDITDDIMSILNKEKI